MLTVSRFRPNTAGARGRYLIGERNLGGLIVHLDPPHL